MFSNWTTGELLWPILSVVVALLCFVLSRWSKARYPDEGYIGWLVLMAVALLVGLFSYLSIAEYVPARTALAQQGFTVRSIDSGHQYGSESVYYPVVGRYCAVQIALLRTDRGTYEAYDKVEFGYLGTLADRVTPDMPCPFGS